MVLGKVVGNLVAPIKKEELSQYKLLVVEPVFKNKKADKSDLIVAIDLIGAGIGSEVIVLQGSQVQNAVNNRVPADAAVIGLVELTNIEGYDAH